MGQNGTSHIAGHMETPLFRIHPNVVFSTTCWRLASCDLAHLAWSWRKDSIGVVAQEKVAQLSQLQMGKQTGGAKNLHSDQELE